jgi:tripartite-type tricarboxylate transporter receptor subunit TctC
VTRSRSCLPGTGTTPHLSGELLKRLARIEFVSVPYSGGDGASVAGFSDLVGGRVDALFSSVTSTSERN